MRLAFTKDFPLNTRLITAPEDGAVLYIVSTPLLNRRWTTTVIRWEGGTIRRAGQIAWGVLRRPTKLWIGTQEWMLDDFLRKPRWYKWQWIFGIGPRKFVWRDSMLPFARVKLIEVDTEAVVAYLTHPFLGRPTLSVDETRVNALEVDTLVITAIIIEHWRHMRRS